MQIYISRDGEQNGPYSIEDVNAYLKDGTLLPTDLACQEGMDEWVPLNKIQLTGLELKQGQLEPAVDPTALKEEPAEAPDTEEVLEVSKGRGNKRLIFVVKSVVVFALFGFLFYWASEVTFREPPALDSNNRVHQEWRGWKTEWTKPAHKDSGPVKYISEFNKEYGPTKYYGMVAEEMFEWNRAEDHISGWLFFMGFCGVIFGVFCAHSWSKKVKETQDFTTPFVPLSLRNWLMGAAIILTLIIIPFEIRNGLRRGEREANFKLIAAVVEGEIEKTKTQLSDGANVNVIIGKIDIRKPPLDKLTRSDQATLKWVREGLNPLHIACIEGHYEIVEILLSKGASVNAKAAGRNAGKTPLDFALTPEPGIDEVAAENIAELLRKHGAKASNEKSKTKRPEPADGKALSEKVVGTYQIKLPNGLFTLTLLKDGTSLHVKLDNSGEEESGTGKWKIEDGNLVTVGDEGAGIMKINPDGSLTMIATIEKGVRKNLDPKISSLGSMKKIK